LQILSNRAYLVAQVDAGNGRFVSKAVVTAEGPEQAVRKVRLLLSKKGDQTTESPEMHAIELGDVPDSCKLDSRLILKFGDEFEW
jgi:hypothetical protein